MVLGAQGIVTSTAKYNICYQRWTLISNYGKEV